MYTCCVLNIIPPGSNVLRTQGGTPYLSDLDDRMRAKNQNPQKFLNQNLTPEKSHAAKQVWLYFIRRTKRPGYAEGTTTNLQIVLNIQKKALLYHHLNHVTQKILAKLSYPKKQPESKISNPQKIPLTIPVTCTICTICSWSCRLR